jgi:hypothetical protein
MVAYIEQSVDKSVNEKKQLLATKMDVAQLEVRLSRTMYIIGLGQFLAIVASVLALMKLL